MNNQCKGFELYLKENAATWLVFRNNSLYFLFTIENCIKQYLTASSEVFLYALSIFNSGSTFLIVEAFLNRYIFKNISFYEDKHLHFSIFVQSFCLSFQIIPIKHSDDEKETWMRSLCTFPFPAL